MSIYFNTYFPYYYTSYYGWSPPVFGDSWVEHLSPLPPVTDLIRQNEGVTTSLWDRLGFNDLNGLNDFSMWWVTPTSRFFASGDYIYSGVFVPTVTSYFAVNTFNPFDFVRFDSSPKEETSHPEWKKAAHPEPVEG